MYEKIYLNIKKLKFEHLFDYTITFVNSQNKKQILKLILYSKTGLKRSS